MRAIWPDAFWGMGMSCLTADLCHTKMVRELVILSTAALFLSPSLGTLPQAPQLNTLHVLHQVHFPFVGKKFYCIFDGHIVSVPAYGVKCDDSIYVHTLYNGPISIIGICITLHI